MTAGEEPIQDDRRFETMQRAMGRGALEDAVRTALARVDGAPEPQMGPLEVAMGSESQIRIIEATIRDYLQERRVTDTRGLLSDGS